VPLPSSFWLKKTFFAGQAQAGVEGWPTTFKAIVMPKIIDDPKSSIWSRNIGL
jgi:hypothetical protein